MSRTPRPRVLLVDDEQNVLEALRDMLFRSFETVLAVGGREAVQRLDDAGPFAVVLSDLRMPEIDGSTVLAVARQRAPEATRILLTGYAEVDAAIEAVNKGHVFRFLTKPCPKETLVQALVAGVAQHRLVVAERELVEETLRGAVEALSSALALANPAAFGRATRLRTQAGRLARAAGLPNAWEVEIAAMLSQIGCLSLPPDVAERYYFGKELDPEAAALVARIPRFAASVVGGIPRLEGVCTILNEQHLDAGACSEPAQVLRIVHDADVLESSGFDPDLVPAALRGRGGYDDTLLGLYAIVVDNDEEHVLREVRLGDVRPGMTFVRDVSSPAGALLVPRGHVATTPLVERVAHLPVQIRRLTTFVALPAESVLSAA